MDKPIPEAVRNPNIAVIEQARDTFPEGHYLRGALDHAAAEMAVLSNRLRRADATAAQQQGQAVAWQRSIELRPGYWGEWAEYTDLYDEGRPEKVGRFNCRYRPLYTAPPSAPVGGVTCDDHTSFQYCSKWSHI